MLGDPLRGIDPVKRLRRLRGRDIHDVVVENGRALEANDGVAVLIAGEPHRRGRHIHAPHVVADGHQRRPVEGDSSALVVIDVARPVFEG